MHPEDKEFVNSKIALIQSEKMRIRAYKGYDEVFRQSYMNEPIEYKKMNVARKSANKRLLAFIKKLGI